MRILWLFVAVFALSACAQKGVDRVVLETELGAIEIDVYTQHAPISATNFLYYVDNDLYNGEGFYRVVRPETDPRGLGMQIVQGGLLGLQSVTAHIEHETTEITGLTHTDGAVSIARDTLGTGSAAYFFISIGDNTELDYGGQRHPDGQGFAAFGQVVRGMDVVRAIQARKADAKVNDAAAQGQFLSQPVIIHQARRK